MKNKMSNLRKNELSPEDRLKRYQELHPNYDFSETDITKSGNAQIIVKCLSHKIAFESTPKKQLAMKHACPLCLKHFKPLQPPTWRLYRSKKTYEMIPYTSGFDMSDVIISPQAKLAGSPKPGDFIYKSDSQLILVEAEDHRANYELI